MGRRKIIRITRITLDLDDRNINHVIKALKVLRRYGFTKKLEINQSPSKRGYHIIAWSQTGVSKKKLIKIRRKAGDDKIRCDLDARSGRQINVLFTNKKKSRLTHNPFSEEVSFSFFDTKKDVDSRTEQLSEHDIAIFCINKKTVDKRKEEMKKYLESAKKVGRPMYAIHGDDIDFEEFADYPWRQVHTVHGELDDFEMKRIMSKILKDAQFYKSCEEFK